MTCAPNCLVNNATFDADPDIAGEGVISAFLAIAWLTMLMAIVGYLTRDCIPAEALNGIDRLLLPLPDSFAGKLPRPESVQSVLLALGDLQLVTGTSIYLVAYIKHCTITQYHFNVAALQAQAAMATYTSIALTNRGVLRRSRFKRLWRWPWVIAICIANIISSFIIWDDDFLFNLNWGLSVQCAWEVIGHYSGMALFLLIVEIWQALADMTYTTALFFPSLAGWDVLTRLQYFLLSSPVFLFQGACKFEQLCLSIQSSLLRAIVAPFARLAVMLAGFIFLVVFFLAELVISTNFQLFLSYISLASNSALLVSIRQKAAENGMEGDENSWGFGQILPILLLSIPLFESIEALFESKPKSAEDAKSSKQDTDGTSESRLSDNDPREQTENEELSIQPRRLQSLAIQLPNGDGQKEGFPLDDQAEVTSPLDQGPLEEGGRSEREGGRPRRIDTEMNRSVPSGSTQSRPRALSPFLHFFSMARSNSLEDLRENLYRENRMLSGVSAGVVYFLILFWYHLLLGTGAITSALTDNPYQYNPR